MFWHPWMVALLGIAAWLFIRLLAPLEPHVALDSGSLVYIGLAYSALLLGCFAAEFTRKAVTIHALERPISPWDGDFAPKPFWWCVAISLFAMALRAFDRFVLRGIDYSLANFELREQLTINSATPLSAFSAVLLPFCFLPLILLLGSRLLKNRTPHLILAIAIFCIPSLETVAQLSRSVLVTSLILALVTIACLKLNGKLFTRKLLIPSLLVASTMLVLSTAIFDARLGEYGRTISDSLVESGYGELIGPTIEAQQELNSGEPITRTVYAAVLPNAMYYVHGLYEFSLLWTRPDTQYFGYGTYTFGPYFRAFYLLTGDVSSVVFDEELLVRRVGVFSTFFGSWWVDFGWFGIILLLFIGFGITRLADRSRLGQLNILPLYLFSLVIVFLMPVTSFLQAGIGFFAMNAFALFALFTSFSARSNRPTNAQNSQHAAVA